MEKSAKADLKNMSLHSQATLRIKDSITGNLIYIDPFEIAIREKADMILITHPHGDHCDFNSIAKLYSPGTSVLAPKECIDAITVVNKKDLVAVEPKMSLEIKKVKIRTMPAYNIVPSRLHAHPKENGWVGYVLFVNDEVVYHAGDTDNIPELTELKDLVNLGFLPIGDTFTMNVNEAVEAVKTLNPDIAVPMHYKRLLKEKALQEADRFKKEVEKSGKTKVEIFPDGG
ncbi:MAG: MBL fold metallo-hydrolase [Planctomycetes bacterium]|nr:MBL fold metallo-hydrolase [Planctomycetota bacterium]